ncbi:outer membrane protein assembly factor BamD [Reichenbachiella ulvae]|uniref:Outer membrane protein assembly factor BamD n=1 Tax=Reichenbachiella ulvae TaxID=2980104 RepID=A0ABT3CT63_9BACT|nr:outer membrane protein assembly factor BamD [Reichenbachiella ulvae]MCV9386877.1 outer membrane protein assembly factor BamD [Reichenbachiella ulvae]
MKKKYFIFIILTSLVTLAYADKSKQALRAIEKEDYEKAEEFLERSYKADSLNPLVSYAYALYYVSGTNPEYDLDRSHKYMKQGLQLLPDRTEDHIDEMDKVDVLLEHFDTLQSYIHGLAYQRATQLDEVSAYQYFLSAYDDASEVLLAETRRNELVFAEVEKEGTWEAYQSFIEQYPRSLQYATAKKRFDQLIFEERTGTNQLDELKDFLIEYPNSPYRAEVEAMIYTKMVTGLVEEKIVEFINSYNNARLTQKALGLLYHSSGIDESKLKSFNRSAFQHFMDSMSVLENLNNRVLYPFYKDQEYTFYDLDGEKFEQGPFEQISSAYRCGNVQENILDVQQDGVHKMINRAGTIIYEGEWDSFIDLGNGVLVVTKGDRKGAITVTGEVVLDVQFEEISLLDHRLLAFQQGGKVGLAGVTGQIILEPAYDDIFLEGSFWIVEQDGVFGVANLDELLKDNPNIPLEYEEVELINKEYIVGYTPEFESLINKSLKVVTPDSTISINTMYDTWTFKTSQGYHVFDKKNQQYSDLVYHDILQNYEWMGLKREQTWVVYSKNMDEEPILGVDSVKMIGDDIAILFTQDRGMALFPNREVVEIQEGQYIKALSSSRRTQIHYLVIEEARKLSLYRDGKKLFSTPHDEIGFISDSIFSVKDDGVYGAVDIKGRLVLKVRYDAIAEAKNGVSDVLYDGAFGAYNFNNRTLLNIDYRERFATYNDRLFIVKGDDGYGLLSGDNKQWLEGAYDKIEYWSDSAFIGLRDDQWEIRKIYEDEVLIDGIDGYRYLSDSTTAKTIEIRKGNAYGVYHEDLGLIVPVVFNDVYNLGGPQKNLYMAEKVFPEGDYYVVVYYDDKGEKTRSEAYRGSEYELIVCDD